jgi:hypothetical protein
MAYQNISKYQNTTNYSERDINKKFNLVEFNKIFEQNNLALANKDKLEQPQISLSQVPVILCPTKSEPKTLFIIVCSILILGILLLLFNNFILLNVQE